MSCSIERSKTDTAAQAHYTLTTQLNIKLYNNRINGLLFIFILVLGWVLSTWNWHRIKVLLLRGID